MEAFEPDIIDHPGEKFRIMIARNRDHRNTCVVEVNNASFKRSVRLEVSVFPVSDITGEDNPIHSPIDCLTDNILPHGSRRTFRSIQPIGDPSRMSSKVEIASAEEL
jgi:hypothetical protein